MADTLHVVPLSDLIEHDTATGEAACVCGPTTQPIRANDGTIGWLITHHSLDGREHGEARDA